MGCWNTIKTKSPKWVEVSNDLYSPLYHNFFNFYSGYSDLMLFLFLLQNQRRNTFDLEGQDVAEDLDGIDFDNLEALANTGKV